MCVEKLTFATALDLSMGYCNMILDTFSSKYCVTILPWRLYAYTALSIGLCISSDIFQASMNSLFLDMLEVYVYVDNIIILSSGSYDEHLNLAREALDRPIEISMQVNPLKTSWMIE